MTEPRHPSQREMWEGLTGMGCLGLIALFAAITVVIWLVNG